MRSTEAQIESLHGQIQNKMNSSVGIWSIIRAKLTPPFINSALVSLEEWDLTRQVINLTDDFPLLDYERVRLSERFSRQVAVSYSLETVRRASLLSPTIAVNGRRVYNETTQRGEEKMRAARLNVAQVLSEELEIPLEEVDSWLNTIDTAAVYLENMFSSHSGKVPTRAGIQILLQEIVNARPKFDDDQLIEAFGDKERRKFTQSKARTRRQESN